MRNVTRLVIAVFVMMLWAAPSWAQVDRNVTFQIDMTPLIDACQFDAAAGDIVTLPGSFNGWDTAADTLSDADADGVYTTTLVLKQDTTYNYKFWTTPLEWENDPNRTYTVTADEDQTVDVATYNKDFADACGAEQKPYTVEFRVDMGVAALSPKFDPENDIVTVAGSFNGWSTTADTLQQDFIDPSVYTTIVNTDSLLVPGEIAYKFVIGKTPGEAPTGWEAIADRKLPLTGNEEDIDGDGRLDIVNGNTIPYFDNVGPDQVFPEETTVTFEVDLRPAFYYLEDNGRLPNDTQTGDPVEALNGLWLNGPVMGAADGLTDWATWGPNDLGAMESRHLVDDGTKGDAVAGDSIYTLRVTYPAGAAKAAVGKFGTDGYDNEAGFGVNNNFTLSGDAPVVHVFGAILQADGTLSDDCGPSSAGSPDDCDSGDYDPYILIDNSAGTVLAVRSGGEADGTSTSVEPVDGELPTQIALGDNYPNPFNPSTTFEYTIARAEQVTVRVYDALGRVVATLVDGVQPASTYRVTFDASNLASGMYLYQLETPSKVLAKTMMLVK